MNNQKHTNMGLCFYKFLLLCFLSIFISPVTAKRSFRPKALMLTVQKDAATLQYVTQIKQRTPLVPVKLTVHLGGVSLWVDCGKGYVSSTNRTARCGSAQCNLAGGRAKICGPSGGNGICGLSTYNPISNTGIIDSLRLDVVSIESVTDGRAVTVPEFIFLCGSDPFVLQGLASGVTGIAALGRSKAALPSQFAAAFSFHRTFAICLSPSSSNGIIIFGDAPNDNVDVSKSLTYTPLIINPVEIESGFLGIPSNEYFIGVKSIKVARKAIPLNRKLLSIDKNGYGGTKISTAVPYTVLETSIYNGLVQAFVNAMPNVTRVAPVAPFGACFNSSEIGIGSPSVPQIDLVLQNNKVLWSIIGANSIVQVGNNDNVSCLGLVDGGSPRTSIVIGGYQLENNLLRFDLASSRLGFSNSLLLRGTFCSNFKFTSI